jgi:hypothetical protein
MIKMGVNPSVKEFILSSQPMRQSTIIGSYSA